VTRPRRHRLGDWTCPSGNNVVAYYCPLGKGRATIRMAWDTPPPLLPADEVFYLGVIQPAVVRLVAEYTEQLGTTVVLT
jgi:hypothetical protein